MINGYDNWLLHEAEKYYAPRKACRDCGEELDADGNCATCAEEAEREAEEKENAENQ